MFLLVLLPTISLATVCCCEDAACKTGCQSYGGSVCPELYKCSSAACGTTTTTTSSTTTSTSTITTTTTTIPNCKVCTTTGQTTPCKCGTAVCASGNPYCCSGNNACYTSAAACTVGACASTTTTSTSTSTSSTTSTTSTTTTIPAATSLTQTASPASPQLEGTAVTFNCYYTSGGSRISGASCSVNIDGTGYTASITSDAGGPYYYYSTSSLLAGTHSWYCSCSKASYASQTGSSQSYQITCNDPVLGKPVVVPSSPGLNSVFSVQCPTTYANWYSGWDCLRAYVDGAECNLAFAWSGSTGIFSCAGVSAGPHTAVCKIISGTSKNCCSKTSESTSFTVGTLPACSADNPCGPCVNCGGTVGKNCNACEICDTDEWNCKADDIAGTCNGDPCTYGGCSGNCQYGICQLANEVEQCRGSKGNCNGYTYVQGDCRGEPIYNHWHTYSSNCVAIFRQAVCFIEDCTDDSRCGNSGAPISCGGYVDPFSGIHGCVSGELCKFDSSINDCKCVKDTVKCPIPCPSSKYPDAVYGWRNIVYRADVSINVTNPSSNDCYFTGYVVFEIRKDELVDPHCSLDGICVANDLFSDLDNRFNYRNIQLAPGQSTTITETFTPRVSGQYHFDVWYDNDGNKANGQTNYYGRTTGEIYLDVSTIVGRCGVSCFGTQCGDCERCTIDQYYYGASCADDDSCTCGSGCNPPVNPETGQLTSCVCRSGSCVKYYDADCVSQGLKPWGCKCRPREWNNIYLGSDGCEQSGCISPSSLPKEAACRCQEGCGPGQLCGGQTCGVGQFCTFHQTGSTDADRSGSCSCDASDLCKESICDDLKDNDGDGLTDCKDPDCVGKIGPNGRICCQVNTTCAAIPDATGRKGVCSGTPRYECDYPACDSNADCTIQNKVDGVNTCCDLSISLNIAYRGSGNCVALGTMRKPDDKKYLCAASSPAEWKECGGSTVGTTVKSGGVDYTCTDSNGKFEWVGSASATEPSLPDFVFNLLWNFSILFLISTF